MPWDNRGAMGIKEERRKKKKEKAAASHLVCACSCLLWLRRWLLGVLLKEHQHAVGIGLGQGV